MSVHALPPAQSMDDEQLRTRIKRMSNLAKLSSFIEVRKKRTPVPGCTGPAAAGDRAPVDRARNSVTVVATAALKRLLPVPAGAGGGGQARARAAGVLEDEGGREGLLRSVKRRLERRRMWGAWYT